MIDDIDTVQKKLEGRCLVCSEYLPDHAKHCELNPSYNLSIKLVALGQAIEQAIDQSKQLVEDHTDQLTEIQHMIDTIQNKDIN